MRIHSDRAVYAQPELIGGKAGFVFVKKTI